MKNLITSVIALLLVATAFAQGSDDACQFSQTYYQGTAKGMGMGNALGAVGGDMTAICINPAGMGIYRSDEFTTTVNLLDNYNTTSYYGTQNGGNKIRLSIPNVGYVYTKQKSNYRSLRYTQFGIGLTRTNDFNMHTIARGVNPTSSKTNNDTFLSQIAGISPEDLSSNIFPLWETYLIDDHYDEDYYYTSNVPKGNIMQSQENTFKGRTEEWSFAGSANYSDRFFVGVSLNITHIKRVGTRVFEESSAQENETHFNSWNYSEDLSTNGVGCNAKLGFIYHANSWLRIGGAFHSPTIYTFDESWQPSTESQFNWVTQKYISAESNYEYTFISPLKWVGSMAFIMGQNGLVCLDMEYANFGAASFTASDWDYGEVNDEIKSTYGKTLNFRLGGEWCIGGSYLRLGAAYYGSPYGFGKNDGSIKKASCGISLPVSNHTTFDFAYELTYGQNNLFLYNADNLEPVRQRQFKNNLAVTLKVKLF